jgi:hypothetical protein
MNDHDRDIILALAAGTLDDEASAVARSRIASDPELTAAFEEQMVARVNLRALEPVAMTGTERDRMRRDLVTALHLDGEAVPQRRARQRSLRWWQPVLGIAAVATVVTAIVVIPGGLSGSDSSSDDVALTTIVPASGEVPVIGEESDGGADAGGADTASPPASAEVLTFDDVDGSDLLSVTEGQTDPRAMSESIEDQLDTKARSSLDVGAVEQCLEVLGSQLPEGDKVVLGEILGSEERDTGLVVFLGIVDPDTGVEAVVTVDVTACRIVDIDE